MVSKVDWASTAECDPTIAPCVRFASGRYKLIVDRSQGTEALYDLDLDSGETTDFGPRLPRIRSSMREQLEQWRSSFGPPRAPAPFALEPEEIERLRALGYVQ